MSWNYDFDVSFFLCLACLSDVLAFRDVRVRNLKDKFYSVHKSGSLF